MLSMPGPADHVACAESPPPVDARHDGPGLHCGLTGYWPIPLAEARLPGKLTGGRPPTLQPDLLQQTDLLQRFLRPQYPDLVPRLNINHWLMLQLKL
jgi:hypothetical protein